MWGFYWYRQKTGSRLQQKRKRDNIYPAHISWRWIYVVSRTTKDLGGKVAGKSLLRMFSEYLVQMCKVCCEIASLLLGNSSILNSRLYFTFTKSFFSLSYDFSSLNRFANRFKLSNRFVNRLGAWGSQTGTEPERNEFTRTRIVTEPVFFPFRHTGCVLCVSL